MITERDKVGAVRHTIPVSSVVVYCVMPALAAILIWRIILECITYALHTVVRTLELDKYITSGVVVTKVRGPVK